MPWAPALDVELDHVFETVDKKFFPGIGIGVVLGKVAVVCHYVKAEPPVWGLALCMQSGDLPTELCRLRKFFCEFIKLTEIVVGPWKALERAPSSWLRGEASTDSVDSRRRLEFAFQGFSTMISDRYLLRT